MEQDAEILVDGVLVRRVFRRGGDCGAAEVKAVWIGEGERTSVVVDPAAWITSADNIVEG